MSKTNDKSKIPWTSPIVQDFQADFKDGHIDKLTFTIDGKTITLDDCKFDFAKTSSEPFTVSVSGRAKTVTLPREWLMSTRIREQLELLKYFEQKKELCLEKFKEAEIEYSEVLTKLLKNYGQVFDQWKKDNAIPEGEFY